LIGERLAELRKDYKMLQQVLAEMLCVSVATISAYENNHNNPDDETKIKIAEIFNVSIDYLLGTTNDEVKLNRSNIIILPKDFPEDARVEVQNYANYMAFQYKRLL